MFNFIYILRANVTERGYNEKGRSEKYTVEEKRESMKYKIRCGWTAASLQLEGEG